MQVESVRGVIIDTREHIYIKEENYKTVCVIYYTHIMPDKIDTTTEPVVATALTVAEKTAAFHQEQDEKRYEAGLRAAAENKANRERDRVYWRGY